MITDKLHNCELYSSCKAFETAFDFLNNLSEDSEEKRYELGNGIYAVIESYTTKAKTLGRIEAHKKFIDIQMPLSGSELIGWQNIDGLTIETPYDADKDIMFFSNTGTSPVFIEMQPFLFMLLFPEDGHMPQISNSKTSEMVKKVVVKIPVNLLKK